MNACMRLAREQTYLYAGLLGLDLHLSERTTFLRTHSQPCSGGCMHMCTMLRLSGHICALACLICM